MIFLQRLKILKLKSKKWRTTPAQGSTATAETAIEATVTVKPDGSVTVEYNPTSVKNGTAGPTA